MGSIERDDIISFLAGIIIIIGGMMIMIGAELTGKTVAVIGGSLYIANQFQKKFRNKREY